MSKKRTRTMSSLPRTCGDEPEDLDQFSFTMMSAPHLRG